MSNYENKIPMKKTSLMVCVVFYVILILIVTFLQHPSLKCIHECTVAYPTVGMARKQYGGSNQCISVYMVISLSGNKCSRLKVH